MPAGKNFKKRARQITSFMERLPREMSQKFKAETPVRTGNARRNTSLRGNEITANYAYAKRLEKDGWSRQAPNGMSKPTIEFARNEWRKLR